MVSQSGNDRVPYDKCQGQTYSISFETDKKKYTDFIDVCAEIYRLRDALKKVEHRKSIAELVVNTTLDDKVSFLKNHFWIWDNHVREKKWDAKKIKYARNIFNQIYLTVDEPSIK